MECARNHVLLIWEAIRQPDLEGTINLVDILWPCLRRQLVFVPEGLVNVKNDIVRLLRFGLRLPGRTTLYLASSSRGWGGGLFLDRFTFLGPNLHILGQSRRVHLHPASHHLVLGLWEFAIIEDHHNCVRLITTDYLTAPIPW
jgi:hypothetical protein